MLLTIISKVMGLARELSLSYFFGASSMSDAYLISLTIPTVVFSFIGLGIKTTFIPMYREVFDKNGIKKANEFTNNVSVLISLVSTIIVIIVQIFTVDIVKLFASGFEGDTLVLAVQLTRITIFSVYIIGLNYVCEGYLQTNSKFLITGLIGIPLNIIIVLSIVAGYRVDTVWLGIGQILAVLSQLGFMIPFIIKQGYKVEGHINLRDKNLSRMLYLSIPVILGTSVNQINKLVDRTIASSITVGGISALVYANRLNLFIQGTFVLSVTTVMFPMVTKMASQNNIEGIKKVTMDAINGVTMLLVPISIGSMLFSTQIVDLIFGRGAFDIDAIQLTASSLFYYSIGITFFGLREILARTFYSLQDTKTPMINAAIGVAINIVFNIIFSKYLGVGGLALATSIAGICITLLMFISLRRKIGALGLKNFGISLMKVIFASIVMAVIAKGMFMYFDLIYNQNIALLIAIVSGAVVYFVSVYLARVEGIGFIKTLLPQNRRK